MRASQPEPLPSLGMRVLELWRYPIKSIGGERLDVAEVAEFGIVGDRGWGLVDEEQLAAVREGRERRPSVVGDSALAWVLARLDRCEEAVEFARSSLRTGYRDPLFVFRAAWAESCAGNDAAARELLEGVLEATPDFSPRWAPVARAIVAGQPVELPGAP